MVPAHGTIPSFIYLDPIQLAHHGPPRPPRPTTATKPLRPSTSTTPRGSSPLRRGRRSNSRVRGKHGLGKPIHPYGGSRCRHHGNSHHDNNSSTTTSSTDHDNSNITGSFNKEARLAQLKSYMQSRRQRLRQRLATKDNPLDVSDLSLDEADVLDEDDDQENKTALDPEHYRQHMWELEQRLCERSESATKTRSHFLMERRASAGERVVHVQRVVQRQRTEQELRQHRARDELEQKMIQAMARRNAYLEAAIENDPSRRFRRKSSFKNTVTPATLPTSTSEATPEHIKKKYHRDCARVSEGSSAGLSSSTMMHSLPAIIQGSSLSASSTDTSDVVMKDLDDVHQQQLQPQPQPQPQPKLRRGHERGSLAKNSAINMTHTTKQLTNMTSEKGTTTPMEISPSITVTANTTGKKGATLESHRAVTGGHTVEVTTTTMDMDVDMSTDMETDHAVQTAVDGLEKMTLWAQRRIRERMVRKAAREYMKAIGGSHKRVLSMRFEELARLLHTNKSLVQATLKLLKYSSQLVLMDTPVGERRPRHVFKNPARVFLSMYMVLAHPSQIRSPAEPAPANTSPDHAADDAAFDSLIESSKVLLESLQAWLATNLNSNEERTSDQPPPSSPTSSTTATTTSSPTAIPPSIIPTTDTVPSSVTDAAVQKEERQRKDSALVRQFDEAWVAYYNFFEAWKNRDAQRLLKTLLDHARQIESIWRRVQDDDPAVRSEWEPRVEEMRKDLRAKAAQLAGDDGAAQLDEIFAGFVSATSATDATSIVETSPTTPQVIAAPTAPLDDSTSTSVPPMDESLAGTEGSTKKRQRTPSIEKEPSESPTTSTPPPSLPENNPADLAVAAPETASEGAQHSNETSDSALEAPAIATAETANQTANQKPRPKKPSKSKATNPTPATAASATTTTGPANDAAGPTAASASPPMAPTEDEILGSTPFSIEKPTNWSNWQMIHELALDVDLKLDSRGLDDGSRSSDSEDDETTPNGSRPQTLQDLVRSIARKAYFDQIREETEQGHLSKWINPLLTSIRERLLEMVSPGSATSNQITEALDLDFVQQQVDKGVFDIKAALAGVLTMMSQLCAPVRDAKIKQIQDDLNAITQNPLASSSSSSAPSSSSGNEEGTTESTATKKKYSMTTEASKDLVSVLQEILDLLDVMVLDLANFRLAVARPKLEKQAIPYEQQAFRGALAKKEVSLLSTETWLRESAVKHASRAAAASTPTASVNRSILPPLMPFASVVTEGNEQNFRQKNKYYEILVQGVLDLLFSKQHFNQVGEEEGEKDGKEGKDKDKDKDKDRTEDDDTDETESETESDGGQDKSPSQTKDKKKDAKQSEKTFVEDKPPFPVTFALDRERLMRFQNEIQGLSLVAVLLNISQSVSPAFKEEEMTELKNTLLKIIEGPYTSKEDLAEVIIDAKERSLLLASRSKSAAAAAAAAAAEGSSGSGRSTLPKPSATSATPSTHPDDTVVAAAAATAALLLSEDQKNYILHSLDRAISFDSTLYKVLSDRLRQVLEFFMLSTVRAASGERRAGVMPEMAQLNRMGLGPLAPEIETLAGQIRYMTKYNAQVYRFWYDPLLTKILASFPTSFPPSSSSSTSTSSPSSSTTKVAGDTKTKRA